VLRVLAGTIPALALGGVTCQRESLKAGGRMDRGGGGERTAPLLAEMLRAASHGAGERAEDRVPTPTKAPCVLPRGTAPEPMGRSGWRRQAPTDTDGRCGYAGAAGEAAKQAPGVAGQRSAGLLSWAYLKLVLIWSSLIAVTSG